MVYQRLPFCFQDGAVDLLRELKTMPVTLHLLQVGPPPWPLAQMPVPKETVPAFPLAQ